MKRNREGFDEVEILIVIVIAYLSILSLPCKEQKGSPRTSITCQRIAPSPLKATTVNVGTTSVPAPQKGDDK